MKLSQCVILIGTVFLMALTPIANSAELTGVTRDAVLETGISAVKVRLYTTQDKRLYKSGFSNDSGKYKLTEVKAGDYLLVFEKTGYTAAPKETGIKLVESDAREQNARLYKERPDSAYIGSLADKIKVSARGCPSVVRGYEKEWEAIQTLPAEFRVKLAHALKERDAEAATVQPIKLDLEKYNQGLLK
ncbi:MAG TPA: SdrD B-like domain-containing protein [Verrucomicrobiae bacterium]|nr:SdrD B-like domain-containing protein [Verrucomicrobiae bacterium]